MKIAHIADIQVKNRETNLYQPYWDNLNSIVNHLKNDLQDVPILVIAGDLFEYPDPNDSERSLIYNFLSELVKIPHLKEIILIAGNHDLEKTKKSKKTDVLETGKSTIGHNALNIFIKLLKNLSPTDRDKFIYIDKSKIYDSKVYENLKWVGYSLEDDMNIDTTELDTDNINICIYHAMIKEFVDTEKLPIRKDIYQTLHSIEEFPANAIIMAGDIHQNLHYKGSNNQNFYYPGSTQQHTHSEGDYYTISDSCFSRKKSELKGINVFEIFDKDSYRLERLPIGNYVKYFTLELDITKSWDVILNSLKSFLPDKNYFGYFGLTQTYIKIKTSNVFASKERQMFELFQNSEFSKKFPYNFRISFDYEKITAQLNTTNSEIVNDIIKEVVAENVKSDAISDSTSENVSITPETIDSLVLSDKQVMKLFASTADEQINNVLKTDRTEDLDQHQLKTDILTLFAEQLQDVSGKSKKYSLVFKDICCNQFMALGQNRINLDTEGITRILGTNGIGKTTLYRMIRWLLTGEVFEGMRASSASKNNMIVFNKNLIDNDHVIVKMSITNNGTPVIIERTAIRKWKNNTTREQKLSINWKDYVSTIDRSIKLIIKPSTPEEKIVIGDNAESNIALWIGNSINTIMFINQMKIENLLKSSSSDLNEMILSFIGVDYLQKLEDNLDYVKTQLMSVGKPTISKEDIRIYINNATKLKTENEQKLDELKREDKSKLEQDIENQNQKIEVLNSQLVNIGNIPQLIETKELDKNQFTNFVKSFVKKELLSYQVFEEQEPQKDLVQLNILQQDVKLENDKIAENDKIISDCETQILQLKENILLSAEKSLEDKRKELDTFEIKETQIKNRLSSLYQEVAKFTNETYDKLVKHKGELIEKTAKLSQEYVTLQNTISNNNKTIETGVCFHCKRPYSDDFEALKEKLTNENQETQKLIDQNSIILKELTEKIQKIEDIVSSLKLALSYTKSMDFKCFETSLVDKNCQQQKEQISDNQILLNKIREDSLALNRVIEDFMNSVKLFLMYDVSNVQNLYENKDFIALNNLLKESFKEYFGHILSKLNRSENSAKIKEKVFEITITINSINNEYTRKLEEYNKKLKEVQEYNKNVDEKNENIQEYNSKYEKALKDLQDVSNELEILSNIKLPEYNQINDKIAANKDILNGLKVKLEEININITKLEVNINQNNNDIEKYNGLYDNYLKYERNQLVWKIYSKIIRNNFKHIIFEYYRIFLNNTLDMLLEDVNFKLFWDNESNLYMIDFHRGEVTYTPINQSSGMETIFCGLSLIYTISLLNIKNACSHIFIDELSGQLSKGDNLTHESKNFQELFVKILNKFNDKNIFIIDHNIKDLTETTCYEVSGSEKGSIYAKQ